MALQYDLSRQAFHPSRLYVLSQRECFDHQEASCQYWFRLWCHNHLLGPHIIIIYSDLYLGMSTGWSDWQDGGNRSSVDPSLYTSLVYDVLYLIGGFKMFSWLFPFKNWEARSMSVINFDWWPIKLIFYLGVLKFALDWSHSCAFFVIACILFNKLSFVTSKHLRPIKICSRNYSKRAIVRWWRHPLRLVYCTYRLNACSCGHSVIGTSLCQPDAGQMLLMF